MSAAQRENSAPIDFSDPGAQAVLDEFAGSRLGIQRVEELSRSFLMAEDSSDATLVDNELTGFYQALFDALVENEQITERALLSLARFRARTVIDQLARHGVDRDRLDSGDLEAVRASVGQGVPTRFELLLSKPPAEPQEEQPSQESESFPPSDELNKATTTRGFNNRVAVYGPLPIRPCGLPSLRNPPDRDRAGGTSCTIGTRFSP